MTVLTYLYKRTGYGQMGEKEMRCKGKINFIEFMERKAEKPEEPEKYDTDKAIGQVNGQAVISVQNIKQVYALYKESKQPQIVERMFTLLSGMDFESFLDARISYLLPRVLSKRLRDEAFIYCGFTFYPYSQLSESMDLKEISSYLYSMRNEKEMQEIIGRWNYEEFYRASGNSQYDLFLCKETGKLYLPGRNELFEWMKGETYEGCSEMG